RHTRSDRDWSSDVCSSDLACPLISFHPTNALLVLDRLRFPLLALPVGILGELDGIASPELGAHDAQWQVFAREGQAQMVVEADRSEERRVGKEGWSRGGRV